jgi:hypothetical protein
MLYSPHDIGDLLGFTVEEDEHRAARARPRRQNVQAQGQIHYDPGGAVLAAHHAGRRRSSGDQGAAQESKTPSPQQTPS